MSDTSRSTTPVQRRAGSTAWAGMALFGRIMTVLAGGFQIMPGLVIHAPAAHGRELKAF